MRIIEEARFDVNLVPQHAKESIGGFVVEMAKRYFSRPGVEENYQAWLKEYQRIKGAAK